MLKNAIPAAAALMLILAGAAPAWADSPWTAVTTHYEEVRLALANDSLDGVAEHAIALRRVVEALNQDLTAESAGVSADFLDELASALPEAAAAARELEASDDLEAARDAFYALTKPLVRWRQATGSGPVVAYCPMKRRSWLQPAGEAMGNPYYGEAMRGCGDVVGGA